MPVRRAALRRLGAVCCLLEGRCHGAAASSKFGGVALLVLRVCCGGGTRAGQHAQRGQHHQPAHGAAGQLPPGRAKDPSRRVFTPREHCLEGRMVGAARCAWGWGAGEVQRGGAPTLLRAGVGSGFIWDDQGHVVTNFHVIAGASEVRGPSRPSRQHSRCMSSPTHWSQGCVGERGLAGAAGARDAD